MSSMHYQPNTPYLEQNLNSVDDNPTAASAIDAQELNDGEPSQLRDTTSWSFRPVFIVPAGITSFVGDPSRLTMLYASTWSINLLPMDFNLYDTEAVIRDTRITPILALMSPSSSVTGTGLVAGGGAFYFDMGGMEQDPRLDVDATVNHPYLHAPARIGLLLSPLEEVLPPPVEEDFMVESHANFGRGYDVANAAFGGYGGVSTQAALSLPPYYAPPSHNLRPSPLAYLPPFASQSFAGDVLEPQGLETISDYDDEDVCHGVPSIVEAYLAAVDGQDGREDIAADWRRRTCQRDLEGIPDISPTQVLGKRLHEGADLDQDLYDDGSDNEGSIYTASLLARDLSTLSPRKRFKAGVQDKEKDEPNTRTLRSVVSTHGAPQCKLEAREVLWPFNLSFSDDIQQRDLQETSDREKPDPRPVACTARAHGTLQVVGANHKGHDVTSSRVFKSRRWKRHGKTGSYCAITRSYSKVRRYICYGCVKSFPCEDTFLRHIKDSEKQGCRDALCLKEGTNSVDYGQHKIWAESCACPIGEDPDDDEDEEEN